MKYRGHKKNNNKLDQKIGKRITGDPKKTYLFQQLSVAVVVVVVYLLIKHL